jgi:hypothetical protein
MKLYAERGSPKYEKAALRWLARYLTEGENRRDPGHGTARAYRAVSILNDAVILLHGALDEARLVPTTAEIGMNRTVEP